MLLRVLEFVLMALMVFESDLRVGLCKPVQSFNDSAVYRSFFSFFIVLSLFVCFCCLSLHGKIEDVGLCLLWWW